MGRLINNKLGIINDGIKEFMGRHMDRTKVSQLWIQYLIGLKRQKNFLKVTKIFSED